MRLSVMKFYQGIHDRSDQGNEADMTDTVCNEVVHVTRSLTEMTHVMSKSDVNDACHE